MSQKLSLDQEKYSTTETEWMADILAIKKFRSCIEEVSFTVVSDQASLQWLYNLREV